MKKAIFILLTAQFLTFQVMATASCPEGTTLDVNCWSCGETCTATLNDNGVFRVTGSGKMDNYPPTPGSPWNARRYDIQTVIVEDGITQVGTYAFRGSTNLHDIEIEGSVKKIANGAFDNISNINSITVSDKTVWSNQEDFNTASKSPSITIYCRGILKECENNLNARQTTAGYKGATAVAKYGKRIYTVQEASEIAGKKNSIKIRYK